MATRTRFVRAGDWRTLEKYWNVSRALFFRAPAGVEIRVRYSGWWFGVNRQRQTLDGESTKTLRIGRWSAFVARAQAKSRTDVNLTYEEEAEGP